MDKMRRKQSLWCFLVLLCCSTHSLGQAWSGIIDTSRAANWAPGISGGVPIRNTVCTTVSMTSGSGAAASNTTAINNAIVGCPANEVVSIPAGTWYLNGVNFGFTSNVTLRGAGPLSTILKFLNYDTCQGLHASICIRNSTGYDYSSTTTQPGGSNATTWTAGYSQGTTSITVGSTTGLSIGSTIVLDQANDSSDTSGYYVCDGSSCRQDTAGYAERTISGAGHSQSQLVTVTNIAGNVLTISPGLYAPNWRTGQGPGIWWTGTQVTGDGVESLTIDNTANSTVQCSICFFSATNSWVRNIRSVMTDRTHVWIFISSHIVVRDSYFYGTLNAGSESYGVETALSSDDLVENNIFHYIASPTLPSGCSGCVFGYNYSNTDYYTNPSSFLSPSLSSHTAGNEYNLFEGNSFSGIMCDATHGFGGATATYFRNQLTGFETGKTASLVAVILETGCRDMNVIGNVLGAVSQQNTYESSPVLGSRNCYTSVYNIGFPDQACGTQTPPTTDSLVGSTLFRWGNYDVVTAAVRWCGKSSDPGWSTICSGTSEVPTTGVTYINGNSVPATTTLPKSFYLSSQPLFFATPWGTPPWPPIGPDVSGGTGPGGHAYANSAQLIFNNTPADTNYSPAPIAGSSILAFNGNPLNLQAIAH